ncbi:hypothetical protein SeMB42_g01193 [Synchytrium endobioticum]|uniref:Uncharacterized protein n=1 Tax=Synchytrium endobioticum TaxID=286115 RepID=A0A507DM86_9FUNG|nr:hypothetical protein SeMB42_g01193 [Synchytrium endobioticum]
MKVVHPGRVEQISFRLYYTYRDTFPTTYSPMLDIITYRFVIAAKCIILLFILASCHQTISMHYPEASGSPEQSSVEASDKHATWNTRRGFREPETVTESVIHRDIVGRKG